MPRSTARRIYPITLLAAALLACLLIASPASAQGSPPPGPPPAPGGPIELGGQVHMWPHHLDQMRGAGMTWIKLQVTWTETYSSTVGAKVNAFHRAGFKVLLSITGDPYPDDIDYGAYVAYLGRVAGYQPDAIEVWNEMNLATEWPAGRISPSGYVRYMLAPAYRAIKSTSPDTLVISGALASTGVHDGERVWNDQAYAQGMARAGAARYADCIGFHYNAGATSPRAISGHPADPGAAHYSWYFAPTVAVYRAAFPDMPLCLTEIGYLSAEGGPRLPSDWGWAAGTSLDDQAVWLSDAVRYAREMGGIPLIIVWNVDFITWTERGDPQGGFAIIRSDGSCPACGPLSAVVQGG
jgi:hypothetical protein